MKKYIIILIALVAATLFFAFSQNNKQPSTSPYSFDGKNVTFTINARSVSLINGISKTSTTPDTASMDVTTYFGNEATGDLNGDGLEDTAFLVTQSTGGSGTFYYVLAALQTPTGYTTTNAFYIGDRIAPQSTEIRADSKELRINFAERKKDEPMTAKPTIGTTLFLKVTSAGTLEELVK